MPASISPLDQGFLHGSRLHLHDAHVHLGVRIHELGEEVRDEIGRYGGQHAYDKGAVQRLGLLVYDLAQALCLVQHLAGLRYHGPAVAGYHHGLPAAVKDFQAQLGLELLYHCTQRGLGHVARKGGLGKVAIAVQGHDIFKLLQSHV